MGLIHSYALWNNKGGVGKSTITFHLSMRYAELHPEPSTRIQLWKLGRSGILNPFIMDICCCVLDAGVNLADVIDIEEADMCLLELHKKQAELLGFSCDSIILKTFSRSGRDRREPVNNYIGSLKRA